MPDNLSSITDDTWRALTRDYSQYQELLELANARLDIHQRAGLCRHFITPPFLVLLSVTDCPEDIGRLLQILRTVSEGGQPQSSHAFLCAAIKARRLDCHHHLKAVRFALNSSGARLARRDFLVWQALDRAAYFDLRCGLSVIEAQAVKRVEVHQQMLKTEREAAAEALAKTQLTPAQQDYVARDVKRMALHAVYVSVTRELWMQQLAWLRASLKLDGDPQQQPALPGFDLENMARQPPV